MPMAARGWLLLAFFVASTSGVATARAQASAQAAMANEATQQRMYLRLETGGHTAAIRRLALDEARGIAVTASDDKTARVWDLRSGQQRLVLRPPIGRDEIGRLYGVAIHPAQPLVAVGGVSAQGSGAQAIYLFNVDSGQLERTIDARGGDIKHLAWSADGSVLLAGYAGNVQAGSHGVRAFALDGQMVYEKITDGPVYGLASGRAGLVAATDFSGRLHILRARAARVEPLRTIETPGRAPVSIALRPDEKAIIAGYFGAQTAPQVFDLSNGRVLLAPLPGQSIEGNFMTVAWSLDGQTLYVAGTASRSERRYPVWRFAAAGGDARGAHDVAGNSVLDLVPLRDGRIAYASFDGSWGIVGNDRTELRVAPPLSDLRGPSYLQISADARSVSWTFAFGTDRAWFDFDRRVVHRRGQPALTGALLRRSLFDQPLQAGFDAGRRTEALVNGVTLRMSDGELASAGTYLRTSKDALLGTTRALARINAAGLTVWRTQTSAEVNAVTASADDRLIVTAMADGTLRWWRGADGVELLAFFPVSDGRWIAWTPEGYFDAGAGADSLVGWVVNRGPQAAAELHSLGRFRDRYHRPDIIDRLFETLDTRTAIAQAPPSERPALLAGEVPRRTETVAPAPAATAPMAATPAPGPAATPAPAAAAGHTKPAAGASVSAPARSEPSATKQDTPAVPVVSTPPLPPALVAVGPRSLQAAGARVELAFALRRGAGEDIPVLEVRVDGRPVEPLTLQRPAALDGVAQGVAVLDLPPGRATVQLLARSSVAFSEPLTYDVIVAPAPPPAPQPLRPKPTPSATPSVAPPVAAASVAASIESRASAQSAAPSRAAVKPTLYLLAIGVSEYKRQEYRLGLPAKDARDFAQVMGRQQGRIYGEVHARVLTDARATRAAVIAGLDWLANAAGPDDVAVLFLAGHGVNEHNGQYYFLGSDAQHERLEATGVAERHIRDALRRIRGRALFFVDTCFAGNVVGNPRSSNRELARLANDLASAENGIVVFASSSGRQLSEENDEWGNGAFTKAIIDGLSGGADLIKAGRVTFKGLDYFVSEHVRRMTDGRQTPVTIVPVGVPDFALASI
jgi:WD40 repeat protein